MRYQLGSYFTEIIETNFTQGLELIPQDSVFIIDQTVAGLYPAINAHSTTRMLIEADEANKDLKTAEKIFSWLQGKKANRNTTIVAVGGGITTDLAGWVAANYMRGCHLIFIPTTLVGMIDAAIGGKTAINFHQTKNLIGSFYPAEKVMIIPELLRTLPEKEHLAGLAELIKMALLPDSNILKFLNKLNDESQKELKKLIMLSIDQKMKICNIDLHDKGERRILNLGHTFAHVIESATDYQISHGRAVAIGIVKAARMSYIQELINKDRYDFIIDLMSGCFPAGYLKLDKIAVDSILKTGRKFYENDKKSKLILFAGEDNIYIANTIEWSKFKDILISEISLEEK